MAGIVNEILNIELGLKRVRIKLHFKFIFVQYYDDFYYHTFEFPQSTNSISAITLHAIGRFSQLHKCELNLRKRIFCTADRNNQMTVAVFCPVLSCPVLSCPVLSCPVLSCSVLFCSVLFCSVLYGLLVLLGVPGEAAVSDGARAELGRELSCERFRYISCCVVLCCVVLYCVVLCCVVLCCVVLCCVLLCCVVVLSCVARLFVIL
jgi:hypothetical protein